MVALTTDNAIFNTSRPSDHCILEPPWHIAKVRSAATLEHGKPLLLLSRETSHAQEKLKIYF